MLKYGFWQLCSGTHPYFHANSTASMAAHPAFNRFNASNGTHVVDLVWIVLASDAPSPPHGGKAVL